jgi:hypothetical protein
MDCSAQTKNEACLPRLVVQIPDGGTYFPFFPFGAAFSGAAAGFAAALVEVLGAGSAFLPVATVLPLAFGCEHVIETRFGSVSQLKREYFHNNYDAASCSPCPAPTTATAVMLTMPRTVEAGVTICAGFAAPSRIGPIGIPAPSTLMAL